MFSGVISWFYKSLPGVYPNEENPGFEEIELKPNFIKEIGYASGHMSTVRGEISASWRYENGAFFYDVVIPEGVNACFEGQHLKVGRNKFIVEEKK